MSRYVWSDTLEPVLDEGVEADEEIQQLGENAGNVGRGRRGDAGGGDGRFRGGGCWCCRTPYRRSNGYHRCGGPGTVFDDIEEVKGMESALLRHYNGVALTLAEDPRTVPAAAGEGRAVGGRGRVETLDCRIRPRDEV